MSKTNEHFGLQDFGSPKSCNGIRQGKLPLRLRITALIALAAVVALPNSALAQFPNISTVVDSPNSATWLASCPASGTPLVPNGASQIGNCSNNPARCNVWRKTIDTRSFPAAMCSDGSPGVFYVRPGVGAGKKKWVIHLQGGGGCSSHGDCLERWCGVQDNLPYTANKMSSDWNNDGEIDLPVRGFAPGMADDSLDNPFGRWNHVWMYYCSSDAWVGRASNVDYTDPAGVMDFSVNHQGHAILDAVRTMLRNENPKPKRISDNGVFNGAPVSRVTMPDLDNATDILFTGTSAGAVGAVHNVDWFMSPLPAKTKRLVVDGYLEVSDAASLRRDVWMDLDENGTSDLPHAAHRMNEQQLAWVNGRYHDINAFVDQSCLAKFRPGLCSLDFWALSQGSSSESVIETQSFVRIDLEDRAASKRWTGRWPTGGRLRIGGSSGRVTTLDDFTVTMRETLVDLYNNPNSNVTGVFAPRCATHVGLESRRAYVDHLTRDARQIAAGQWLATTGPGHSFRDVLWDWYTTGTRRRIDTSDVGDPTDPNDPVTDPVAQTSYGVDCRY